MATVTLSKGFSFVTVRGWWNNLDDFGSFDVLATTGTRLSVTANNEILTVNGSGFKYPGGILGAGTVTSIEYQTNGSTAYKVTGLSLSAQTLVSKAINGSTQSVYSYAFSGNDTFNGSAGSDSINGYAGIDTLMGNAGADILRGGLGNDTLTGGTGKDGFRFDTTLHNTANVDTIKDFSVVDDTVQLENAIFKKLTATGQLNSTFFKANLTGVATDANDYIVYEKDTGKLFYDADGNGAGAKVLFAVLGTSTHPAITAADFVVV